MITPKIKVCGLRNTENINQLIDLPIDYFGFIFYEGSKRYAKDQLEVIFAQSIQSAQKVGVFVNADIPEIFDAIDLYQLQVLQLHGEESPDYCSFIKQNRCLDIIKAFAVDETFDFKVLLDFYPFVDYFLFDTKGIEKGGNGITFDWNILNQYNLDKPFFLSGGIGLKELSLLETFKHPQLFAYDINSKFEISPGLKDVSMVKSFVSATKK